MNASTQNGAALTLHCAPTVLTYPSPVKVNAMSAHCKILEDLRSLNCVVLSCCMYFSRSDCIQWLSNGLEYCDCMLSSLDS